MTERIRNTGDVLILYDDQHTLLRVTEPTRLLGARYGEHVVTADGGLAAYGSTAPERINDSTPRFRITRSGPTPTLDGPIELSP